MAILTDFFVADRRTALDLDDTSTLPSGDVAVHKGLTELELSLLQQLMRGESASYDPRSGFEMVRVAGGGDRVTTAFPSSMVRMLARLDEAELEVVARAWGQCEELTSAASRLEPVLRDLKRLAAVAWGRGVGLYVWNCVGLRLGGAAVQAPGVRSCRPRPGEEAYLPSPNQAPVQASTNATGAKASANTSATGAASPSITSTATMASAADSAGSRTPSELLAFVTR